MESTGGRRRNLQCFPPGRLQADLYLGSGRVDARSGQRIEYEWSAAGLARGGPRGAVFSAPAAVPLPSVAALLILPSTPTRAETLPEVLVRTYQGNPVLNAERARLRGIDETVPMAVAAYRPQIMAMLTGGLQQVRVLFPDNTVQTATLRTWTIGLTVSQTLVQRLQDREYRAPVRGQCALGTRGPAQCRPGRAARRGDRLYQRARQPDPGGSPAHQRRRFCARRSAPPASVSMPAT